MALPTDYGDGDRYGYGNGEGAGNGFEHGYVGEDVGSGAWFGDGEVYGNGRGGGFGDGVYEDALWCQPVFLGPERG